MVEILVSIAGKVAEYVVDPVVRQLGYVYNHRANIQKLSEKVEEVKGIRDGLQRSAVADERNGREIHDYVSEWLTSADGFIRDAGHLTDDESNSTSCFKGLCPNLKSRYLLGRKAAKKAEDADQLFEKGSKFGSALPVSYLPPLQLHQPITSSSSSAAAASIPSGAGLESRTSILNEIMEALAGEGSSSVNKVGVWGLPGVGKTTLVNQLAQQAADKKLFDEVLFAAVLSTPDYNKIQQDLSDQLGLQFVEGGVKARAARLRQRIMKREKKMKEEKTILVILDDLWKEVDLEIIGVPSPDDYKGCKLLLTSRDIDVLSNQMGTQKDFEIKHLGDEEASILFKNTAGADSIKDPNFESLATEIAKECRGLPIAIVTVAKALKNKTLPIWKDALLQLRTRVGIPTTIPGMDTKVYQSLRLSYDFLENDEIKSFFRLCSLYPGGYINATDMVKYGMGLRLFNGIDTLEDARNRIESLFDKLKASNLLLHTGNNSAVLTMHDLIRNVGIQVAFEQHGRVVAFQKAGGRAVEKWQEMDDLRKLTMLDLVLSDEFPEGPVCPNLKYLVCTHRVKPCPVTKIPDTFFNEMKGLNVLDLTNMHLPSLPPSLECLTNLRTLCLDSGIIGGDITVITELKTIEILSLVDSNIEELPKEITRLTRLRLLDLKDSSKLKVVPANVIASLTRLESLCMENSFSQWEMEGGNNACLAELQHLPDLTYLDIQIPDVQLLPKDTTIFDKLERYRIFIGDLWSWERKFETNKTLKLSDFDKDLHMVDGIKKLLKRTEDLHLCRLRSGGGTNYALSRLDGEGFPKLKHLNVERCEEIRYVMKFSELIHPQYPAFPVLEKLLVSELSNLQEVFHGQFPVGSFSCLREIKVKGCRSLKFLFSMTMARSLSVLDEIQVTGCESMENVVARGSCQELIKEEDDDHVLSLFPKLRYLTLEDSPKILSFCSDENSRLQHASTILFDEWVAFPSLELLRISKLNLVKKIWHVQLAHDSFSNLKEVHVTECGELLNIFPSCMLRWLQSLRSLMVKDCDSLEEVFDTKGGINNANEVPTVTQMSRLLCQSLPNLKQIWNVDLNHIISFRNLKEIVVYECQSLKSLFPTTFIGDLKQLQHLCVRTCAIEEIVAEADKTEPMVFEFPKLTALHLSRLHQLKNFYRGPHISRWPSLRELMVDCCHQVINLFALANTATTATTAQDHEGGTSDISTTRQPLFLVQPVAFPCLEELALKCNDHVTELWQEQFPVDFPKLRVLNVEKYHHISVVIPPFMLQRMHNLEALAAVECKSVKEIFQLEGVVLDVKNQAPWLGCLRVINLLSLPELMHIWKGNSEEPGMLELKSLEILTVGHCESLKFLLPQSMSFQNLQSLAVWSCGSLRSLMSASVAKTLVKLKTLEIGKSHKMEEVIDSNGGEETLGDQNEIVFAKLEEMKLRFLPNLTSFCSGGSMFSFPSLDQLKVKECPKMKIFSSGNVVAPMLKSIKVTKNKSHWKENINSTIHDLFAKMHA